MRALSASVKSSRKYRQITASIKEVGLVEPPVVTRSTGGEDTYMLLDGHIRIEVLKDLGIERVECLISTDDEAFTYNKRISRLAPIQEHKMIRKAIERGVSEEKIALALDLNPRSIVRKAKLLDGICEEAVGTLPLHRRVRSSGKPSLTRTLRGTSRCTISCLMLAGVWQQSGSARSGDRRRLHWQPISWPPGSAAVLPKSKLGMQMSSPTKMQDDVLQAD